MTFELMRRIGDGIQKSLWMFWWDKIEINFGSKKCKGKGFEYIKGVQWDLRYVQFKRI